MQPNNDNFVPVEEFAARHGLEPELVIRMIQDAILGGRLIDDRWFVDLTSPQTREYLSGKNENASTEHQYTSVDQWSQPSTSTKETTIDDVRVLRTIGIISILYGVVAGLVVFLGYPAFVSDMSLGLAGRSAQLYLATFAVGCGITLFYCAIGVACMGVAEVIKLLRTTTEANSIEND